MADSALRLSSRALITVAGPDWRGFLQGLLTQDVESLAPGEIRFGALLTPQGKLLHDLFILGRDEGCWLDVAADQREPLIQRLSMYRLRAKVEIAADEGVVGAIPSADPGDSGASGIVVRDPRLPALGWRTYGAAAEGDEAAYEAHRLALGVPAPADWGVGESYPIEADFDLLHGIDFQKGCFVGQETTSRMKRRGQIRSRMLALDFDGPAPAPASEILAGDLRAGEVLSGTDGRAIALVRLDRIEGAELSVDGRLVRAVRPDWFPPPNPQGEGDPDAAEGASAQT